MEVHFISSPRTIRRGSGFDLAQLSDEDLCRRVEGVKCALTTLQEKVERGEITESHFLAEQRHQLSVLRMLTTQLRLRHVRQ